MDPIGDGERFVGCPALASIPRLRGQLLGQIVVSADTARRQARRLQVPLALELDLLVTHGTLHLVGYDDRDPLEADLMHRRERDILRDAPDRLWTGLLHEASGPRPSRTGHLRPKPVSRRPLQQSNALLGGGLR